MGDYEMLNQILTLITCGLPLLLLVIVSAFIGDSYRRKLATRIMAGAREGRFRDFSSQQEARKIRGLLLIALFSNTGILITLYLAWADILPYGSNWIIFLFVLLLLTGIIAGGLLYRQVLNRLKK
jgi:hypothetical protein